MYIDRNGDRRIAIRSFQYEFQATQPSHLNRIWVLIGGADNELRGPVAGMGYFDLPARSRYPRYVRKSICVTCCRRQMNDAIGIACAYINPYYGHVSFFQH